MLFSLINICSFTEREENVKVDIFNAYIALLKQSRAIIGSSVDSNDKNYSENLARVLREQIPLIVRSLHKQLREKSIKTRQGSFALLTEVVNVLPGSLTEHVVSLIPGILYSLRYLL